MFHSQYIVQRSPGTSCPNGHSAVRMLVHRIQGIDVHHPAFYLCMECSYIGEIGKGPVREEDSLDPEDLPGRTASWFVSNMDGQLVAEGDGTCWYTERDQADKAAKERASRNPGMAFYVNRQVSAFTGQPVQVTRQDF